MIRNIYAIFSTVNRKIANFRRFKSKVATKIAINILNSLKQIFLKLSLPLDGLRGKVLIHRLLNFGLFKRAKITLLINKAKINKYI